MTDSPRDRLLDELTAERYDNRWWTTPTVDAEVDDDLATARRRRQMAADFEQLDTRKAGS